MFRPMAVPVAGAMNNGQQMAPNVGMSAGRIDIEGQMGVCDRGGVQVSRAQPAVLSGLITDEQWNGFCDRVDEVLKPVEQVKDLHLGFLAISAILLLVLFIGGMVLIAQVSSWDSTNSEEGFWIFMLVAMAFIFIGGIAVTAYGRHKAFEVRHALMRVCDDVSNRHPNISFHVKFEAYTLFRGREANTMVMNYIEVSVKNPDPEGGGPQVVVNVNAAPGATAAVQEKEEEQIEAVPVVKGTAVPEQAMNNEEEAEAEKEKPAAAAADKDEEGEEKKTAAERLAQLETLKDLLTEEEYNEKRKEILASV